VKLLVCTHNDSDHANGVWGFLEHGLGAEEVWLPVSWTHRLADLISRPQAFGHELIEDVNEYDPMPAGEGISYLEAVAETAEDVPPFPTEVEEADPANTLEEAVSQGPPTPAFLFEILGRHTTGNSLSPQTTIWLPPKKVELLIEAIAAANRIRGIALAAYHAGATIRWFEYTSSEKASGGNSLLSPLNAVEKARILQRKYRALQFLSLTLSNSQSLVFFAPQEKEGPPVLFSADSDFSFQQAIPWSEGMIITAPHHGAESSARVYERFLREAPRFVKPTWVRSDGRIQSRPGPSFLTAHGTRHCTLCRNPHSRKRRVRLASRAGQFVPISSATCTCI
jgi:hypothetical protein